MIYPATELLEMCEAFQYRPSPDGHRWFMCLDKYGVMLHPYPFPKLLFRGQSKRYTPCLPTLLRMVPEKCNQMRLLTVKMQADLIFRRAKSLWFQVTLQTHPAVVWALENNVHFEYDVISQHYEIDTGWIDLTHNFEVAAFFATCTKSGDRWVPASGTNGIIYRLEREKIPSHLSEFTLPVGLQPLPRPEEQSAWVTEVPMGFDFETHPAVTWLEFEHDRHVAEYFLDKFNGGLNLFPPDPLARVATHIRESSTVPAMLIDIIVDGFLKEPGGLPDIADVKRCLLPLTDKVRPTSLMTADELEQSAAHWKSREDMFGYGTTTRMVRVERVRYLDGTVS